MNLAVQTYELVWVVSFAVSSDSIPLKVDKHIRRLDSDLKKFEAELDQGTSATFDSTSVSHPLIDRRGKKGAAMGGNNNSKNSTTKVTKAEKPKATARRKTNEVLAPDARVLNVDIDMPIDPNEPTYCLCNRVSFGEMVGCDNADVCAFPSSQHPELIL